MSDTIQIEKGAFGVISILKLSEDLVSHAHTEAQIVIALSKSVNDEMTVNTRKIELTYDKAVCVNPMEEHAHTVRSKNSRFLLVYVKPSWLRSKFLISDGQGPFSGNRMTVTDSIRRWINDYLSDQQEGLAEERTAEFVAKLVSEAATPGKSRSSVNDSGDSDQTAFDHRIPKAIEYMRNHISGHKNFDLVAKEIGVSRSQLFKLFRRHLNTTPNTCWNALRMAYARNQLATSDSSIDALTQELGFTESSNFSRFFRNNTGVYPTEFRTAASPERELDSQFPSSHNGASN